MLRGDFGISFTQQNRRVNDIIRDHFPVSAATLGILAIIFAATGGILWGALTAIYRNRTTRYLHYVSGHPGHLRTVFRICRPWTVAVGQYQQLGRRISSTRGRLGKFRSHADACTRAGLRAPWHF